MTDTASPTRPDTTASDTDCETGGHVCARRQVLLGAAGLGGVALVVAGCGSSSKSATAAPTSDAATGAPSASSGGTVKGIIALSDVPTDTSVSVKDSTGRTLLITQSGGKLTALDATCTHMACTVAPKGAALACPCHGSMYTLTGAVTQGPAPAPLHTVAVRDSGGQVVLA